MRQYVVGASLMAIGVYVSAAGVVSASASSAAGPTTAAPTAPGSAFASSSLVNANPLFGGLSIAVRAAESTASYTGSSAVSASTTVDLGYLGNSLFSGAPDPCLGTGSSAPTVPLAGVQSSSASGPAKVTANGGSETATSSASPESAQSTTTLTPVSVPGLLGIKGEAMSSVAYTAGKSQDATATTTLDLSLVAGLIDLHGLEWTATDNTGTSPVAKAAFSAASVTIAGVTTKLASPAQLASLIPTINRVLKLQGLTLVLPKMSRNAVTGAIAMSPLRLAITGTKLTNAVLGSLSNTQSTLEKKIAGILGGTGNACINYIASDVGVGELVAGIVEGILAGGGVIDLDLGGASAVTSPAPHFTNPLGGHPGKTGSGGRPGKPGSLKTHTTGGTPAGSGAAPPVKLPSGATKAAGSSAAPQIATTAQRGVLRCVTTSPAHKPSCWNGSAPLVGGALLILGGGLFSVDAVRSRRGTIRPRRVVRPKETL